MKHYITEKIKLLSVVCKIVQQEPIVTWAINTKPFSIGQGTQKPWHGVSETNV